MNKRNKFSQEVQEEATLFVITYTIDILEFIVQTLLLGYLLNTHVRLDIKGWRRKLFMLLLQFLGMSNLMVWIYDSFMIPKLPHRASWKQEFYPAMAVAIMDQFMLPFILFFRFFSMHIILESYHRI